MKHFLSFVAYCIAIFTPQYTAAQSPDDQMLIFRNTGEVNLLYASQVDSITMTCKDSLGGIYENPIAQIFHAKDTTLYVPIAEIDSVCFGSRNEIEFRNDVRILSRSQDEQWIIRCEGNTIYYKLDTPSDVLPVTGQKIYYPEQTELFPHGLSVKVLKVTIGISDIAVQFAQADYEEIFSKFFYAGNLEDIPQFIRTNKQASEVDRIEPINFTLPLGEYGEFGIDGELRIKGNVVLNVFKHYYHADLLLETTIGTIVNVATEKESRYSILKNFTHIPLPIVAAVFLPSVDIGLFAEFNGEMMLKNTIHRKNKTHISWTRSNGKQTFYKKPSQEFNGNTIQANTDIILNGSIFAGLQTIVDFALIGDLIGARAKVKYGTEMAGELNMGLLSDLSREYNADFYGRAKVVLTSKAVFEGYTTHRNLWELGCVEETQLLEYTIPTAQSEHNLFPHYFQSKATRPLPKSKEISVATKTNTSIVRELQTGFQIIHADSKKIVDSIFVEETIKADETKVQPFTTVINLPETTAGERIGMRPIFHYAGFTIPYKNVDVSEVPNIQPIICFGGNGATSFVSGTPIIGTAKSEHTTYHIGPFLPIPTYDKDFHQQSPYVCYESAPIEDNFSGTWVCDINDTLSVELTFTSDKTVSIKENGKNPQEGEYYSNTPQSGYVTITFNNNNNNIVFVVIALDENEMTISFRNTYPKNKSFTFRKK